MSNEEIVKEIDEAMESLRETKRKIGGAFSKARNIVIKDSTVDTEAYNKGREEALQEVLNCESYGYEKGLNDAWELAKKIVVDCKDMTGKEFQDIFGYYLCEVFVNYTPQEALAKLEAYEKSKEIKVGDIVYNDDTMEEGVVTHIDNDEVFMLYDDGSCGNTYGNLTKTGKHIDLTDLFKQIGGAE